MPKHSLAYRSLDEIPVLTAANVVGTTDYELVFDASANQFTKRLADTPGRSTLVAGGSSLTLTSANYGNLVKLDTATGTAITLPAATGSGGYIDFVVSVLATSNSHTITCASGDKYQGIIFTGDDTGAAAQWFAAVAGTSTIITLNRTTTGSVTIGENIRVVDFAINRWQIQGFITNTGTAATPFS